jgi:hypothetical protein
MARTASVTMRPGMNPMVKEPEPRRARDTPAQRVGVGQQRPGVVKQLPASWGQFGRPIVPDEQLHLQLSFQGPDLSRQDRLGRIA